MRQGTRHFPQWGGRTPPGRIRQFFHGLSLPFHLAQALLADPVARGRYLRVGLLQTAAAVLLVVTYLGSCKGPSDFAQEEAREEDQARQEAFRELAKALKVRTEEAGALARREGDEDDAAPAPEDGDTAVAAQGRTRQDGEGASDSGLQVLVEWGDDSPWTAKGFSLWSLALWAWVLTALKVAQWVVVALSREYHDAIARDASLLTGVTPEDEELTPRVRLNMAWMRKKLKRRWRAFVLFAAGMPVVWLAAMPYFYFCGSTLASILSTAWAAWWLVVFTAAKSGHAWELPPVPSRPPWFLRAWTWLTSLPGLRWGLLRRYGAFLARRAEEVRAPIATAERHPWAFAGLTLMRFLGSLPPMHFFLRPLIPVASAHLLAEEAWARAAQPPPAPGPVIPAGETGS